MLLMSTGKEFQRLGAATEKEQAPNDFFDDFHFSFILCISVLI